MQNKKAASFLEAKGTIEYNMTNDYMFRYILQKNEKVLRGLICALLHLSPEQIKKVEIMNPIDLAGDISGKEFILDIKVMLNDDTVVNLEMQVRNEHNWPERSLIYLCRAFDQLYRGQDYDEALPVIHIGFVNFTLHPEHPEFYAKHKLMNVKNRQIYSDKFVLSVVDLNQIGRATKEDKRYKIDYWARLFKAKTWEEMKKLVKNNEYLEETARSIYVANADEIVRQQCLAREDAERRERSLERDNRILKEEKAALQEDKAVLEKDKATLERDKAVLEKDKATLEKDKATLEEDNAVLKKDMELMKKVFKASGEGKSIQDIAEENNISVSKVKEILY